VLARSHRLRWAASAWALAIACWVVALITAKGWAAPFAPSIDVMLAPVGVAVAMGAGLGVAAIEFDFTGYRFGWRQIAAVGAFGAMLLGVLPAVAGIGDGRWGVPTSGVAQALVLPAPSSGAGYRVLWVGDPQAMPLGSCPKGPGSPTPRRSAACPTPATPGLRRRPAQRQRSDPICGSPWRTGGRPRSPAGIGPHSLCRRLEQAGTSHPRRAEPDRVPGPPGLTAALGRQMDLRPLSEGAGGVSVFQNVAPVPAGAAPAAHAGSGGGKILDTIGSSAELVVWVVLAAALLGRRRWLDGGGADCAAAAAGVGAPLGRPEPSARGRADGASRGAGRRWCGPMSDIESVPDPHDELPAAWAQELGAGPIDAPAGADPEPAPRPSSRRGQGDRAGAQRPTVVGPRHWAWWP